jgi:hypothetical protein
MYFMLPLIDSMVTSEKDFFSTSAVPIIQRPVVALVAIDDPCFPGGYLPSFGKCHESFPHIIADVDVNTVLPMVSDCIGVVSGSFHLPSPAACNRKARQWLGHSS